KVPKCRGSKRMRKRGLLYTYGPGIDLGGVVHTGYATSLGLGPGWAHADINMLSAIREVGLTNGTGPVTCVWQG
ncbi:hypothetical protein Tco_1100808, partial [Tanacetum coccineum]